MNEWMNDWGSVGRRQEESVLIVGVEDHPMKLGMSYPTPDV